VPVFDRPAGDRTTTHRSPFVLGAIQRLVRPAFQFLDRRRRTGSRRCRWI
jgi:hypothetical protein